MPDPESPKKTSTSEKPKRTLTDEDVVIRRSGGGRSVAVVRGGQPQPVSPNDPTGRGVGHGDPDH
jgi:hypothetical protein